MKNLKFRIWDKQLKVFLYQLPEKHHLKWERFDAQQWTGLFDKLGKEIYEGDIVVSKGYGVGVVEWKDGSLGVEGMSFGEHENEHSTNIDSWEIIGNIYQNPELIN